MRILVVYGTTEGQTRKIGESLAARLNEQGHQSVLRNSSNWQNDFGIETFDRVIVAGSVHAQKHQRQLEIFVMTNREKLQAVPTLFLSVSLSAAAEYGMGEAQAYIAAFLDYTDWQPTQTLPVAGALRYEEYDYFTEQIVQHVVLDGKEQEAGDREYTDWDALFSAVDAFVSS